MALEPAGISLEAKGLSSYISNLEKIDKKQKAIFEVVAQGTNKSLKEVTAAAKQYEAELKRVEAAEKKAVQQAQKLADAQKAAAKDASRTQIREAEKSIKARIKAARTVVKEQEKAATAQVKAARAVEKANEKAIQDAKKLAAAQKTASAVSKAAFLGVAAAAVAMVKQVATAAFELGKIGAQFEAQKKGLDNLAASFGQSGSAISKSIVKASKGTISDLKALQVANEALLLGVAKTPEEFDKFTRAALVLGRTVGISASESITRFTTALGRESLLRLDDFGIKASQVNEEIKRLAQANLGKLPSELSKSEKSAIFIEAALSITGENVRIIGEESATAAESFARLETSGENFKTEIGLALNDLNQALGITEGLTKNLTRAADGIKELRGARAGASLEEQIESTEIRIRNLEKVANDTRESLEEDGGFLGIDILGFGDFLDEAALNTQTKALAELRVELDALNIQKVAEDQEKAKDAFSETPPVIEDNTKAIKAYENALKQAQSLQLAFAREGEDAARKLARANEDLARKQQRAVAKLDKRQTKDRDKLLDKQIKEFDKFENDRVKQISKAEDEIRKERTQVNEARKRDQAKLQRELRQAQDRFNLSRLQSERQFNLSERRLIAEGDILAIQELRENRALEKLEEKESFDLGQSQQKEDNKAQDKERRKDARQRVGDLEENLNDLKSSFDSRRSELLESLNTELEEQRQAQLEARTAQQQGFAEAAQDRAIALQREEEDRRISQRRQLEDLGQSLTEQKDITAQGVNSIADEIERVFGLEGAASNIIAGFSERSRSEFNSLIENVEEGFKKLQGIEEKRKLDIPLVSLTGSGTSGGSFGQRRSTSSGIQAFQEGGVVQGPLGSPQTVQAHAGETILPTHQQSFTAVAPVIPSQSLEVLMSGGFDIKGGDQAGEAAVQAAVTEMTETIQIAVRRLVRRN